MKCKHCGQEFTQKRILVVREFYPSTCGGDGYSDDRIYDKLATCQECAEKIIQQPNVCFRWMTKRQYKLFQEDKESGYPEHCNEYPGFDPD